MYSVNVPGAVITVDPYRGHPYLFWLRRMGVGLLSLGYSAFSDFEQDVVIISEDTQRELYREGPYRGGGIQPAVDRIVRDISKEGLEPFLRSHQIDQGRLGPVEVASGRIGFLRGLSIYLRSLVADSLDWRRRPRRN
jgi:hypothetical protein